MFEAMGVFVNISGVCINVAGGMVDNETHVGMCGKELDGLCAEETKYFLGRPNRNVLSANQMSVLY